MKIKLRDIEYSHLHKGSLLLIEEVATNNLFTLRHKDADRVLTLCDRWRVENNLERNRCVHNTLIPKQQEELPL